MATSIEDFLEKRNINLLESDKLWTKHLQYRNGYIYATNSHIIARVKGNEPERKTMEKNLDFDQLFKTVNELGFVRRSDINKLCTTKDDEENNKLKMSQLFFAKKYLKKVFQAGKSKTGTLFSSNHRYMYIIKFSEIEFAIMAVINETLEQEAAEIPVYDIIK